MVLRQPVPVGQVFMAPSQVTFDYQAARDEFSVWFTDSHAHKELCRYVVVGTGHSLPEGAWELVASAQTGDGFHIFHLLRKRHG